jgi:hypothetical protein
MITWLKSWCECDREIEIEFDDQTVEVLRAIYDETIPLTDDSEDEDYEPSEDSDTDDDYSSSESEPDDDPDSDQDEEIIIKRDMEGNYYLY